MNRVDSWCKQVCFILDNYEKRVIKSAKNDTRTEIILIKRQIKGVGFVWWIVSGKSGKFSRNSRTLRIVLLFCMPKKKTIEICKEHRKHIINVESAKTEKDERK